MWKIRSWSNHRLVGSTPFQTKFDNRRTTKLTRTAEPMLHGIIEFKQAALWHGGNIRIDQASEAATEDTVRQPKTHRISFQTEWTRSFIVRHSSRAHKIPEDFTFCFLRIIVVRRGIASNELWIVSRTEFNGCKRFDHVWRQLCVAT